MVGLLSVLPAAVGEPGQGETRLLVHHKIGSWRLDLFYRISSGLDKRGGGGVSFGMVENKPGTPPKNGV